VARHNLTSEPDAFVANPKVTGLMQAFGDDALPVLVVDGDGVDAKNARGARRDGLVGGVDRHDVLGAEERRERLGQRGTTAADVERAPAAADASMNAAGSSTP
jgi:hypothetical protein